jgi:hypothetical protein
MRIKSLFAAQKRGHAQHEPDKLVTALRSQNKTARILGHDKMPHRRYLDLGQGEYFTLQIYTVGQFIQRYTFSYFDFFSHYSAETFAI